MTGDTFEDKFIKTTQAERLNSFNALSSVSGGVFQQDERYNRMKEQSERFCVHK